MRISKRKWMNILIIRTLISLLTIPYIAAYYSDKFRKISVWIPDDRSEVVKQSCLRQPVTPGVSPLRARASCEQEKAVSQRGLKQQAREDLKGSFREGLETL